MILVDILLWAGVAIVLVCCLGTVVMGEVYARLHFSAPVGLGALSIAVAVLAQEGFSLIADKALLVAAIVLTTTPLLAHLIARAAWLRAGGRAAEAPAEEP